jgi:hypothetical protein
LHDLSVIHKRAVNFGGILIHNLERSLSFIAVIEEPVIAGQIQQSATNLVQLNIDQSYSSRTALFAIPIISA